MTTRAARNDQTADAFVIAVLHRDVEAMLVLLVEVARAGGTRNLLDFVDALSSTARDLIEQLGSDQAENHLRRRLLAAAIQDAQSATTEIEVETTVAIAASKTLTGRRDKLSNQFNDLQAQQADIARDLQIIEEDWRDTLRKGEDTGLVGERRRHRQTELDENAGAIAQVRAWIEEVDAELRRQAPHEQFDRDLVVHVAELTAYTEVIDELDGIHQKAVDALEAAVVNLYDGIATARQHSEQLAARTRHLQTTAAQLGRTDQVPGPPDWVLPLEHALRGGPYWLLYLSSVQARQPTALIRALADAVTNRMTDQLRAARPAR